MLVHWYEGEADRRFVAAASLLRLRFEVDGGIVGRQVLGRHRLRILTLGPRLGVVRALVETLAQAALVLLRLLLGAVALLHLHHSLRAVVLVAYDYDLIDGHGNLETVLVLDQDEVVALEASDTATAALAEKSHFVAYLHILIFSNVM